MRHPLLLTGFLLLLPAAAHAQVTIDLRALEALPNAAPLPSPRPRQVLRVVPAGPTATATLPVPPVPPGASPAPVEPNTASASVIGAPATAAVSGGQATASAGSMPAPGPVAPAAPVAPTAPVPPAASASLTPPQAAPSTVAPPQATASPEPPPATLPAAPPPVAVLAPIAPPAAPATVRPPAPPPVSATSATTATTETSGLRLIFKPGDSELSPAANGAIGGLVKSTPSGDTVSFNVVAYAAGVADDPSIARRVSLSRGLSVRAALMADGVASTRIYVRALGASGGDAPADRVDLTVLGLSGAASGGAAKP